MWVIFHERKTLFTHIDRNVFALVEDKDIHTFQDSMAAIQGEMKYPLLEGCYDRLQNFVGTDYFAKQYVPMTQYTDRFVPEEQRKPEIATISLVRVVELPSPCSNGR